MGYNKGIDVGLGQLGSGYNNDSYFNAATGVDGSGAGTVAIEPPLGKVIASITFLEGVRIRELVPEEIGDASFKSPIDKGDGDGGAGKFGGTATTPLSEINYFSTEVQTTANGSNSNRLSGVTNSYITVMPQGLVIFGRWKKLVIQDFKSQVLGDAGVNYGVITTYSY
mgnify:FL=1|tara:strand:+ start:203 stop:706 length:504 start_codon:yes stop_codon:yes gene_type:complete